MYISHPFARCVLNYVKYVYSWNVNEYAYKIIVWKVWAVALYCGGRERERGQSELNEMHTNKYGKQRRNNCLDRTHKHIEEK